MIRILAPNSSNFFEISSFIIRVMEMRATTVVIPIVKPRMRKKAFPFRLRRLLIEMSLSFMDITSSIATFLNSRQNAVCSKQKT
jgi:hypothetical protein